MMENALILPVHENVINYLCLLFFSDLRIEVSKFSFCIPQLQSRRRKPTNDWKTRSKCIGFNQPTRQKANVCYFTYLNKWSTSCWNVFSIKFNSEITWWANNFHLQIIHQVKIEFSTKNISENQVLPLNWTLQNFNVTVSRATWNMYTQKVFSFSLTFQKEQIIYCLLSQSKIKGVTRVIAVFMNSK